MVEVVVVVDNKKHRSEQAPQPCSLDVGVWVGVRVDWWECAEWYGGREVGKVGLR